MVIYILNMITYKTLRECLTSYCACTKIPQSQEMTDNFQGCLIKYYKHS